MRSILCWLGWHDWIYKSEDELPVWIAGHRTCTRCKQEQEKPLISFFG